MRRMASMLVSGKEALQANSDRHLTASWKESMVAAKCFSNTFAGRQRRREGLRKQGDTGQNLPPMNDDTALASPWTY